ncbi:hypothetical protein EZV77_25210 [Burkholderia thailandensis]|nr:hypothetical protein A8H32_11115 [Burkholderia thailandensis]MDD1479210.1 hypothetical protein [Burkholderia thailandensis]MDD1485754.1 hypothetical protein [Burkholderia thailandensis]MDD1491081.1 hypothetical protein [Burkholderia thailandensis]PJO74168.1 hypothetical protein CWD92_01360 [Burkholderia thailandensis]
MLSLICNRSLPRAERAARRRARRRPRFLAIRRTAAGPRPHRRIRPCTPPRLQALCNCNLQQMGVARDSGFRYIRLMRQRCRRCRYGERCRPPSGEPK